MQVLLIGANGQLAQDLHRSLARDEVIPVTHQELEICDAAAVQGLVDRLRPHCIINTAAFHRVDDCEDQAERAFAVNGSGLCNLARVAQRFGAVLVHFSTDYVFDGTKDTPYVETDRPGPLSVYAMSRLVGEWAVQQYCSKYFVVRTCGLYGAAGSSSKGGNFVETMLRLASKGQLIRVVSDQTVTPTSTRDLAEKLVPLIHTEQYGVYHMTNTGECSWYEFAQEVFRQVGLSSELVPTTTEAFGAKARRPAYSVLDNYALRQAGFSDFRPWQEALAEYLGDRKKHDP